MVLRNLEINIIYEVDPTIHEVDPTKVVQKSKSLAKCCDPPSRPSEEVEDVFVAGPSRRRVKLLFECEVVKI